MDNLRRVLRRVVLEVFEVTPATAVAAYLLRGDGRRDAAQRHGSRRQGDDPEARESLHRRSPLVDFGPEANKGDSESRVGRRGYRHLNGGLLPASGPRNGGLVLVVRAPDLYGLHDHDARRDAVSRVRAGKDHGPPSPG